MIYGTRIARSSSCSLVSSLLYIRYGNISQLWDLGILSNFSSITSTSEEARFFFARPTTNSHLWKIHAFWFSSRRSSYQDPPKEVWVGDLGNLDSCSLSYDWFCFRSNLFRWEIYLTWCSLLYSFHRFKIAPLWKAVHTSLPQETKYLPFDQILQNTLQAPCTLTYPQRWRSTLYPR